MYHKTFTMFAGYNDWANNRLYETVGGLTDEERRMDSGLFFGSFLATLNHILVADRIWLKRFLGYGQAPDRLDAILFDNFEALREARRKEDQRIADWIGSLDDQALAACFTYRPITNPRKITQDLAEALFHFFNHQTHHRGQCHAALTALGRDAPSLDMIAFQRERG